MHGQVLSLVQKCVKEQEKDAEEQRSRLLTTLLSNGALVDLESTLQQPSGGLSRVELSVSNNATSADDEITRLQNAGVQVEELGER